MDGDVTGMADVSQHLRQLAWGHAEATEVHSGQRHIFTQELEALLHLAWDSNVTSGEREVFQVPCCL